MNKSKILLFGSQGMLGYDLFQILSKDFEVIPFSRYNLDLRKTEKIQSTIQEISPNFVINASAWTDTENAEKHFRIAEKLNIEAPREMALSCKKLNIPFIHFSSDFVFDDSKKSFAENDKKNPLNFYGETKSRGEDEILKVYPKATIIRTAWLFGENGANFVSRIIAMSRKNTPLHVADDIRVSMTSTLDLARAIKNLLKSKIKHNIYHIVNEGNYSLFEIAKMILEIKGIKKDVISAKSSDFESKIKRPMNAILENNNTEKLRNLSDALKEFLTKK